MKTRMIILATGLAALAFSASAMAHGSRHDDGLSGSVTIWSGPHAGVAYAGTVNFGGPIYAPAPRYRERLYYRDCGHWHARGFRHTVRHAYRQGYAHGHYKAHKKHRKHHASHHGRHH
ncbi:hypothetical protein [Elongatibacter sediminis]|uniref:Uncharacterized protein n=1 Tax=Elongatibacter sediminis TaxID=3119006 RepID=A0AAW9RIQ7_9GAMM